MFVIESTAALAALLETPINLELRRLLYRRHEQLCLLGDYDLSDLARFVVVTALDALTDVEAVLGFSPLTNFVDGSVYGAPDFGGPAFEYVTRHDGRWLEAVFILSDDGFGVVLIVEDREGVDPHLLALLREHAQTRIGDADTAEGDVAERPRAP